MEDRDKPTMQESNGERDVLGEIIHAAGRRPSPRAEDYEQVLTASRAAWRNKVQSRKRRRRAYALAASVAVVAIGLSAVLQIGPEQPVAVATVIQGRVEMTLPDGSFELIAAPNVSLAPGTRLRTDSDSRASFTLARGASLRLDSGTELRLASSEQIELVAGRIYVDSGAGVRTTQLEVITELGSVRDIGTQFEVSASDAALRVRVREGRVQLEHAAGETDLESAAGEQIMVDASGNIERHAIALVGPEWQWAEALAGAPEIDGHTAFEVLSWVARETGRSLRFEDATAEVRARNSVLRGSGEQLTPEDALNIAVDASALTYRLMDGVILVRIR